MLIKRSDIRESNGRRPYPLPESHKVLNHFVVRVTRPENPFEPHVLWYVQDGEGMVSLGGREETVKAGDLVVIPPGVEHGLRTESRVTWLCMA